MAVRENLNHFLVFVVSLLAYIEPTAGIISTGPFTNAPFLETIKGESSEFESSTQSRQTSTERGVNTIIECPQ